MELKVGELYDVYDPIDETYNGVFQIIAARPQPTGIYLCRAIDHKAHKFMETKGITLDEGTLMIMKDRYGKNLSQYKGIKVTAWLGLYLRPVSGQYTLDELLDQMKLDDEI